MLAENNIEKNYSTQCTKFRDVLEKMFRFPCFNISRLLIYICNQMTGRFDFVQTYAYLNYNHTSFVYFCFSAQLIIKALVSNEIEINLHSFDSKKICS